MESSNNNDFNKWIEEVASSDYKKFSDKLQNDIPHDKKTLLDCHTPILLSQHGQDIQDQQQTRELKKTFSWVTFGFMCVFNVSCFIFIYKVGTGDYEFQAVPLTSLIGTMTASMVLFGWVLKGLFPPKIR